MRPGLKVREQGWGAMREMIVCENILKDLNRLFLASVFFFFECKAIT